MPAPVGDSPRVRSVRFLGPEEIRELAEQRKAVAVGQQLRQLDDFDGLSRCRSIPARSGRRCAAVISACARRLIAAFTVCACSWNRYSGQMSTVPPARSIRVGADARIVDGRWAMASGDSQSRSVGAQQQDGNANRVTHLVDRRAVDEVREEAVAVRGHGDQIDVLLVGNLDDLGRRIAHGEPAVDLEPGIAKLVGPALEIRAIVADFLRLAQLEIFKMAGGEAVGDVHQQQARRSSFARG